MAFLPVNLVLLSVSPLAVQPQTLPRYWSYLTTTDTVATVSAAGYFNVDPGSLLQNVNFNVGDQIYCVCSDASIQLFLTAVGSTGTTTEAITVGIDSVSTADIQNGAVTNPKLASNAVTNVKVDAAAAIAFSKLAALPSGNIIVGSAGTVPTSVAMSGDVTIVASGATTIGAAKVTKAMLAATVRPSHMIVFAGSPTTVGGAAAEAFVVTGAVGATDKAYVQIVDNGTGNVTALQAVVTDDTLTVTFSADPQNDTVFNYQIIRATS